MEEKRSRQRGIFRLWKQRFTATENPGSIGSGKEKMVFSKGESTNWLDCQAGTNLIPGLTVILWLKNAPVCAGDNGPLLYENHCGDEKHGISECGLFPALAIIGRLVETSVKCSPHKNIVFWIDRYRNSLNIVEACFCPRCILLQLAVNCQRITRGSYGKHIATGVYCYIPNNFIAETDLIPRGAIVRWAINAMKGRG